jgi:hypothetical protein
MDGILYIRGAFRGDMRRLVIKLRPHSKFIEPFEDMLSHFESFKLMDLVRIDFEKGQKVGVVEVVVKEGVRLQDIALPPGYEIMGILKEEGRRYVLVAKMTAQKEMIPLFKTFDIDIVWGTPLHKTMDEVVISVMGSEENLRRFMVALRQISDILDVSFQKPSFSSDDLMSCLTEKQREVMTAAKDSGYYQYPRTISATQLAEKLGMSKATILEHLRKAEVRLMGAIMS